MFFLQHQGLSFLISSLLVCFGTTNLLIQPACASISGESKFSPFVEPSEASPEPLVDQSLLDESVAAANTLLHSAVATGDTRAVAFALESGADINNRNGEGETALKQAIRKEHIEVVRFLLDKGVSIESSNPSNGNLMDCMIRYLLRPEPPTNASTMTLALTYMVQKKLKPVLCNVMEWFRLPDASLITAVINHSDNDYNKLHPLDITTTMKGPPVYHTWLVNPLHVAIISGHQLTAFLLCRHNPEWLNQQAKCLETDWIALPANFATVASRNRTRMVNLLFQQGASWQAAHEILIAPENKCIPGKNTGGFDISSPVLYAARQTTTPERSQVAHLNWHNVLHYAQANGLISLVYISHNVISKINSGMVPVFH
ncbi:ankyrin repeat domain-containing protein [Endozoicomonadaceae bacterium StTr2]